MKEIFKLILNIIIILLAWLLMTIISLALLPILAAIMIVTTPIRIIYSKATKRYRYQLEQEFLQQLNKVDSIKDVRVFKQELTLMDKIKIFNRGSK